MVNPVINWSCPLCGTKMIGQMPQKAESWLCDKCHGNLLSKEVSELRANYELSAEKCRGLVQQNMDLRAGIAERNEKIKSLKCELNDLHHERSSRQDKRRFLARGVIESVECLKKGVDFKDTANVVIAEYGKDMDLDALLSRAVDICLYHDDDDEEISNG